MAAGGELSSLFDLYAEQMQESVLELIGMNSTTLNLELMDSHPEAARPHNWNEAGEPVAASGFFEGFIPSEGGEGIEAAGGVATTANDLALYLITQLNRGVSPDGARVVSAENLVETWTPQISINGGQDAFLDRVWLPSSVYNPVDSEYATGMG
jgi:CubicO group peptidase (beta-lactamase class C family)